MTNARGKTMWKALGPGVLWAGAAIGVSHVVQSTRAGAGFGFALLGLVVLANVFKYPAFSFGPRYAAATGTSLLEGYRRRGRWALVLYAALTLGTMFTVQAVVTLVTAAIACDTLGWNGVFLGWPSILWVSLGLMATCATLLAVGHYRWLDRIVKILVVILTLSTIAATALILPQLSTVELTFWPGGEILSDVKALLFTVGLIGWMPSAFDISIWHSLWTLARRRATGHAPSPRESLLDFNIGYFGTAFLAVCFLTLGAGVMFGSGERFADSGPAFAAQVISLYTKNLGGWSEPVIRLSALAVMFSTTLTVMDGFPRAISYLVARFAGPEERDDTGPMQGGVYWTALAGLGIGALVVIGVGGGAFKGLVDLATRLSFFTAPALAWLNHRAMLGHEVPVEHRPGPRMVLYSWAGILFSAGFAAYFLYVLVSS